MVEYVIIDDEPDAIDVIKIHLCNIPYMNLKATFRNPLEAIEYLQANNIDLIFLDINMPLISGMQLPKLLKKVPHIIYTTAYSEYALESYNLNAVDYLLKPIEFDRLLQAVMKVRQLMASNINSDNKSHLNKEVQSDKKTIFIRNGAEYNHLNISDIKYVESDGNYVTFFITKQKIVARYKLSDVTQLLPKNSFIRIHRSYIVALNHIETVKKHCVIIDGKEIPISGNYRENFFNFIESMCK